MASPDVDDAAGGGIGGASQSVDDVATKVKSRVCRPLP